MCDILFQKLQTLLGVSVSSSKNDGPTKSRWGLVCSQLNAFIKLVVRGIKQRVTKAKTKIFLYIKYK